MVVAPMDGSCETASQRPFCRPRLVRCSYVRGHRSVLKGRCERAVAGQTILLAYRFADKQFSWFSTIA